MNRIDKIIDNSLYRDYMDKIRNAENNRKFCLHGFSHALDVARIIYIINLEDEMGFSKDVIYAMALLHDIGRVEEYENGISHHEAGAIIARDILAQCDFTDEEIEAICEAISNHKLYQGKEKDLKYLLFKADKLSRNCFDCNMYDECYWDKDLKNKSIVH